MNKSLITNSIAAIVTLSGHYLENQWLFIGGLFALSGAITNWLAIHMLFERVPGLYGSGVVPLHFAEFKTAIRRLMMTEFFTNENIERFINIQADTGIGQKFEPVIRQLDLAPSYDTLVKTIMESSFGNMLGMFGGPQALEPLKEPFIENMRESMIQLVQSDSFQTSFNATAGQPAVLESVKQNVEQIIDNRLDELTPQAVKIMVQDMIKKHLGWLVVWGGCIWWFDRLAWPVCRINQLVTG